MEGVFELPAGLLDEPELADLRERVGEDLDEIVLARRVGSSGRTRAFVQGRSATAGDLQALGGRLVAFFGQHEHRRLTLASAQLDLLDGFCGREQLDLRASLAAAHARMRELERSLAELRERAGTRDRDLDLLAFEIAEIERARPDGGGEDIPDGRARRACASSTGCWRRRAPERRRSRRAARKPASRPCSPTPSASRRRSPARIPSWTRSRSGSPRSGWRPRTSGRSCAGMRTRSRRSPAGSTSSRSGSSCTTGSSASTAARSRRCSPTRTAAAPSTPGWSRPRSRPSAPRPRSPKPGPSVTISRSA